METRAKTVVLGVTGSIAAYKAADIASRLTKLGYAVQVVMTREAREFITPLTLQVLSKRPVISDLFDEKEGWQPGHIEIADRADLLLIAPATAQVVAELAHGFSNHALAAIALATRAPILLAPAMNGKMWLHPATLGNVETLRRRDVQFIGPETGLLACGYEGVGRLWPTDGIVEAADAILRGKSALLQPIDAACQDRESAVALSHEDSGHRRADARTD